MWMNLNSWISIGTISNDVSQTKAPRNHFPDLTNWYQAIYTRSLHTQISQSSLKRNQKDITHHKVQMKKKKEKCNKLSRVTEHRKVNDV